MTQAPSCSDGFDELDSLSYTPQHSIVAMCDVIVAEVSRHDVIPLIE